MTLYGNGEPILVYIGTPPAIGKSRENQDSMFISAIIRYFANGKGWGKSVKNYPKAKPS